MIVVNAEEKDQDLVGNTRDTTILLCFVCASTLKDLAEICEVLMVC